MRVTVRGPRGNPNGLGAVLRLVGLDGWQRVKAIAGAAGYWSQADLVVLLPRPSVSTRLEVLWPGGRRSTHAVPGGTRELRVDWTAGAPGPKAVGPDR
jgi:hypothetical protein